MRFLIRILLWILSILLLGYLTLVLLITSGTFGELPSHDQLAKINNEQASLIYSSDGVIIGKIFASNRTNVDISDIPTHLINALVATEDKRFFIHQGVDSRSYVRVFFRTIIMGDESAGGGSTITQQLVKNLYGRKNIGVLTLPISKVREAILATRLEKIYSKNDIIVLYLNTVAFGENVFGIEAAAHRYFSKKTKDLTIDESALLIGMLKANTAYNPRLHPERALDRRNQVLQLMNDQQYITKNEYLKFSNEPIGLKYLNFNYDAPAGYFAVQVEKQAREILNEIKNQTNREYDIEKDGLIIKTTLDMRLQKLAIEGVRSHIPKMQKLLDEELTKKGFKGTWYRKIRAHLKGNELKAEPREVFDWSENPTRKMSKADSLWHYYSMLNASVLMMEPQTGKIRAYVGGNNFRFLPYDLNQARHQAASTFKPILYASAIENGISPCTMLNNELVSYPKYDGWMPNNYDRKTGGRVAMWYALAHSMNIPSVDLYFKTGHKALAETCEALGLPHNFGDVPSLALGTMDLTPTEMVSAYSVFAAKGIKAEPMMIESIADSYGHDIFKARELRVASGIKAETTEKLTAILQRVVNNGTAAKLRTDFKIKSNVAGKTGTNQDYTDAWFMCFSPSVTIGVWVGAMTRDVHFDGKYGTGGALAMPITGSILASLEATPKLQNRYLQPIILGEEAINCMDCDGIKSRSRSNEILEELENVFTEPAKRLPEKVNHQNDKPQQPVQPKKDVTPEKKRNIFKRIFGSKKEE